MGDDKIRHLLSKELATGETAYFWNPSKTLRRPGLTNEALGPKEALAKERAIELNTRADHMRRAARSGFNGPLPGCLSRLVADYLVSHEVAELKPRTRKDYQYYLGKVELEFGHLPVRALSARVIKTYYYRVRAESGVTWAYHIMGSLRAALSWAVSEDWIPKNPALDVTVKSPAKRTVTWTPDQAATYIPKATELGWHSLAAMAWVYDSSAQSPIDVRLLKRGDYDGRGIGKPREKTGVSGASIPLFPEAKAALDAYLATKPAMLPGAPLFTNHRTGGPWA